MIRGSIGSIFLGIAIVACSSDPKRFDEELPPPPTEAGPVRSAQSDLDRLHAIVDSEKTWKELTTDIALILKAEKTEKDGDSKAAQKAWIEALKVAPGKFGVYAFDKYIESVVDSSGPNPTLAAVVTKVNEETKVGKISRHMSDNGFGSEQAIKEFILKKFPALSTGSEKLLLTNIPDAPSERIPSKDPLLKATIKSYCSARDKIKVSNKKESWERWILDLGSGLTKYFEAAVADCLNSAQMAAEFYQEAVRSLDDSSAYNAFVVLSYERITYLYRITGRRADAAGAYKKLVALFDAKSIKPADLGDSKAAFDQRKINHVLWASRYQALVGDYVEGRRYALKAIDLIKADLGGKQSQKDLEAFYEYLAEAYHILAFRVAVEKNDFKDAYAWAVKGSEIPVLKPEWRERFWWYLGFYPYMENNFALAIQNWEKALPQLEKESSRKSQMLFWLAHTYKHQKNEDKSQEFIEMLTKEFPLEYYSLIAVEDADLAADDNLIAQQGAFSSDQSYELQERDFDLDALYDNKTGSRYLIRSQILVAARIPHLAQLAIDELTAYMKGAHSIRDKENLDLYVYLSRLNYHNGNFRSGILTTYELSTLFRGDFWEAYPDQMRVYFPEPFEKVYDANAVKTGVSKEILYGITRQESAFQHDAESPAGAVGLMQLIPPTAKRYISSGGSATEIRKMLKDPSVNIEVASLYLKDLHTRYNDNESAMFGAYNAGEYVVDIWLKKRNYQDNLVWVELIPFSETKDYVMKVRRNARIYRILSHGWDKAKVASMAPERELRAR